jgi:hypothetical protein
MARQSFGEVLQFVDSGLTVYVSKLIVTFSTPHIGHSRHGLFFTRLDCQSNAKPSEIDHGLPGIRYAGQNCSGSNKLYKRSAKIDEKMCFSEHEDVMIGKAFAILGFIRILSFEFRDPYTLKLSTRLWFVRSWSMKPIL